MPQVRQVLGLDVLRTLAAMMVMAHHLGFWLFTGAMTYHDDGFSVNYRWTVPFSWFGFIGVEIFFVLSGFVIVYSAQSASAVSFLRGRVVRLYPAAWICATATVVLLLATGHHNGLSTRLLHSILLSPHPAWVDGSYWTLPIEIAFYTLVFLLLSLHRLRWLERILALVGSVSALLNLCQFALEAFGHIKPALQMQRVLDSWQAQPLLLRNGVFFAIGCYLWLCLYREFTVRRAAWLILFVAGALAEIGLHTRLIAAASGHRPTAWVPILVWLLSIMVILLSVRYDDAIHRVLGHRGAMITRRTAFMSYPLYLVHQQAGYALIAVLRRSMPDTLALLLTTLLILAFSLIVILWLEKPLQKALRTLLKGSNQDKRAPAAALP
ncbi:MAG: acyltransferase [Acidobacteriaceae bacterium]|nr:acyltransferase [Acidobacteriaceae bacterium]